MHGKNYEIADCAASAGVGNMHVYFNSNVWKGISDCAYTYGYHAIHHFAFMIIANKK